MAAERRQLRLLVVAQPESAQQLAASLIRVAPERFEVTTAAPGEIATHVEQDAHDAFIVDAACAGKRLFEIMETVPAVVVLSDGELDPEEAASRGAALVLPRTVPPEVLASAVLSTAAWGRDEAALREEREHLLDRLVA